MMQQTVTPYADATQIQETADAVRKDRDLGLVTFAVSSQSDGGLTAATQTEPLIQAGQADESRRGKFTLRSDEPVALLGTDTAVSPAEYLLAGLAGCYMVTVTSLAALKDIELDLVEIELGFDIDLAGFLGVDDSVRKGAQGISVKLNLESNNTPRAELEQLVQELEATSPIRDTLANPVPVTTTLG